MNLEELAAKHKGLLFGAAAIVGLIVVWVIYTHSQGTSSAIPSVSTGSTDTGTGSVGTVGTTGPDLTGAVTSLANQQATDEQTLATLSAYQQQTQTAITSLLGLMSTPPASSSGSSAATGSIGTVTGAGTTGSSSTPTGGAKTPLPVIKDLTPSGVTVSGNDYKSVVNQAGGLYQNHVWDPGAYHGSTFVPSVPTAQPISRPLSTPVGPISKPLGNVGAGNLTAPAGYHKVAVPVNTKPGMHNAPSFQLVKN